MFAQSSNRYSYQSKNNKLFQSRESFKFNIRRLQNQQRFKLQRISIHENNDQQLNKELKYHLNLIQNLHNQNYSHPQQLNIEKRYYQLQISLKIIYQILNNIDIPAYLIKNFSPQNYLSTLIQIQNKTNPIILQYNHSCQTALVLVHQILLRISSQKNHRIKIEDILLTYIYQNQNTRICSLIFYIFANILLTQDQENKKQSLINLIKPKFKYLNLKNCRNITFQQNQREAKNDANRQYLNDQNTNAKYYKKQIQYQRNILKIIIFIINQKASLFENPQFQQSLYYFLQAFLFPLRHFGFDRIYENQYIKVIEISLAALQDIIVKQINQNRKQAFKSFNEDLKQNSNFSNNQFTNICKKNQYSINIFTSRTNQLLLRIRNIYFPLNYRPSKLLLNVIEQNFNPNNLHQLRILLQYLFQNVLRIKKKTIQKLFQKLIDNSILYSMSCNLNTENLILAQIKILQIYIKVEPSGCKHLHNYIIKLSQTKQYQTQDMPRYGSFFHVLNLQNNEIQKKSLDLLHILIQQQNTLSFLDEFFVQKVKNLSDQGFQFFQTKEILYLKQILDY